MNIYLQEFKSLRKSAIIWSCSMSALAVLFLSLYPSVASDAIDYKEILSNYPATIREMLGINLEFVSTLIGLYALSFTFVLLCAAIQAMNLGVSILSREARERTADFLLVKPVSRTQIVFAKLAAAISILVFTEIIYYIIAFVAANIFKTENFNNKIFFLVNFTMFFLQLIFLAIGMFVSVFFKKIKNVLPLSLGFVFGFYLIGSLLATGSDKEAKRFLSPFQYFDLTYIMKHSAYEWSYLLTGAMIVIVCITAGFIIYNKKDIHAVS